MRELRLHVEDAGAGPKESPPIDVYFDIAKTKDGAVFVRYKTSEDERVLVAVVLYPDGSAKAWMRNSDGYLQHSMAFKWLTED